MADCTLKITTGHFQQSACYLIVKTGQIGCVTSITSVTQSHTNNVHLTAVSWADQ